MKNKDKILKLLEKSRGKYISGQSIAEILDISRASVWKNINVLRKAGYDIVSSTNKGYLLESTNDILSEIGIRKYLNINNKLEFEIHDSIDSTNNALKNKAGSIEKENYIIISAEQTMGRGRYSRSFYSPKDSGLYMSILLKPRLLANEAIKITSMAAVSVCDAIHSLTHKDSRIKWVNDIYIDDKKVCGILTEANFDMQSLEVDYIVLGIGINIYKPIRDFPKELSNIAGYILENRMEDTRNKFAAEIINQFYKYYNNFSSSDFAQKYKDLSNLIGKEIYVLTKDKKVPAFVLDIDEDCRLVVKYEDGKIDFLNSGEVSTRYKK